MKKTITLSIALLFCIVTFSQTKASRKNYEKGSNELTRKNYSEALSFLTLSINEFPTADAYYNRSLAYYHTGDSCGFCNDLKKAAGLKDSEAEDLFIEKCIYFRLDYNVPDSTRQKNKGISHFKIVYDKCSSDSTVIYIFEDKNDYSVVVVDSLSPVFTIVEEMPYFVGGETKRNEYMANNIVYPDYAIKKRIQGTVYISFIIAIDGSVTNVKVLRGIGGGCDEEAMRVVREMPKWIPGRQNGKPVRVLFNMPIYFKLSGK